MRLSKKSLLILLTSLVFLGSIVGLSQQSIHQQKSTAIQKGVAYEKSRISSISPYERITLDYLQRKYGIDSEFNASKMPIPTPTGQSGEPAPFLAVRRIAYPNSLVSDLPDTHDDIQTKMVIAAANCDHIALPTDFNHLVEQNISAGKYDLTHVELSLKLMAENGCHYFTSQQTKNLQNHLASGMAKLAADPNTVVDLRYESIAFLLDMGRADLVPDSWIRQIVSQQLPSGGWSDSQGGSPGDHTTVLALWALLEKSRPTAANEPMIRRPN